MGKCGSHLRMPGNLRTGVCMFPVTLSAISLVSPVDTRTPFFQQSGLSSLPAKLTLTCLPTTYYWLRDWCELTDSTCLPAVVDKGKKQRARRIKLLIPWEFSRRVLNKPKKLTKRDWEEEGQGKMQPTKHKCCTKDGEKGGDAASLVLRNIVRDKKSSKREENIVSW